MPTQVSEFTLPQIAKGSASHNLKVAGVESALAKVAAQYQATRSRRYQAEDDATRAKLLKQLEALTKRQGLLSNRLANLLNLECPAFDPCCNDEEFAAWQAKQSQVAS